MGNQEIHKMLPNPLLGREGYEFTSQPVMDLEAAISETTHLIFIFWKIELHFFRLSLWVIMKLFVNLQIISESYKST